MSETLPPCASGQAREMRTAPSILLVGCAASIACHPPSSSKAVGGTASSTSGAPTQATTGSSESDAESGSDTLNSGVPGCPDVYDGHLHVTDDTDVDSLRYVGQVTGNLTINGTSFADLAFLGCLHRVDAGRVEIVGNDELKTLAGLEQLETLGSIDDPYGGFILLFDNPALESLVHLESVTQLVGLEVSGNASLTDLGLNRLEFLHRLYLGELCGTPQLNNAALVDVQGFASLRELRNLEIGQQRELTSLGVLHDVVQRSDPPFSTSMWFWENPKLPYAEIETLLDETGQSDCFHCASLGDPEPVCHCPYPD